MERNPRTEYPEDGSSHPAEEPLLGIPHEEALSHHDPNPVHGQYTSSQPYAASLSDDMENSGDLRPTSKFEPSHPSHDDFIQQPSSKKLSKQWQRRLYWMVPLGILVIVLVVLFEVYKTNFEHWVSPLTNWLRKREAWSWVIPVSILFILSFPPLFGHEIVQLIVGLTYPLGVAIGIACAGSILGEAGCFIAFKYGFTWWVEKKITTKISWAATARVAEQAGFKGVLVIRYSIVPPHLANPLFACTGMKFWLYMVTVILSLPKSMIFIALGSPNSENSKGNKLGKVVAIGVLIAITAFASVWIRRKMAIATKEIELERAREQGEVERKVYNRSLHATETGDKSYKGVAIEPQDPAKSV